MPHAAFAEDLLEAVVAEAAHRPGARCRRKLATTPSRTAYGPSSGAPSGRRTCAGPRPREARDAYLFRAERARARAAADEEDRRGRLLGDRGADARRGLPLASGRRARSRAAPRPRVARTTPPRARSTTIGSTEISASCCTTSATCARRRPALGRGRRRRRSGAAARCAGCAIQAASSTAAQSWLGAAERHVAPGAPRRSAGRPPARRARRRRTAPSRSTCPTGPRGTPSPSSGRRPSSRIRSTSSSEARRT